ncbi:hypothetical protein P7K49_008262 [Saguinus oedipus]|uniref:Clathrin coat assembly protein AP180 n=1 Tax=Saguinus oedipus TaxID=9490 RepID=A0ABQ9VX83_SAGOE|nr:hypothetical protein P7K49_008262 [Saguinus oedipus]
MSGILVNMKTTSKERSPFKVHATDESAPSSLMETLEQHLNTLEGKKPGNKSGAPSPLSKSSPATTVTSPNSTPAKTIDTSPPVDLFATASAAVPVSASKPSSDLLDLQPDFSSGGAAAAAAPAPPPPAGGATAWGVKANIVECSFCDKYYAGHHYTYTRKISDPFAPEPTPPTTSAEIATASASASTTTTVTAVTAEVDLFGEHFENMVKKLEEENGESRRDLAGFSVINMYPREDAFNTLSLTTPLHAMSLRLANIIQGETYFISQFWWLTELSWSVLTQGPFCGCSQTMIGPGTIWTLIHVSCESGKIQTAEDAFAASPGEAPAASEGAAAPATPTPVAAALDACSGNDPFAPSEGSAEAAPELDLFAMKPPETSVPVVTPTASTAPPVPATAPSPAPAVAAAAAATTTATAAATTTTTTSAATATAAPPALDIFGDAFSSPPQGASPVPESSLTADLLSVDAFAAPSPATTASPAKVDSSGVIDLFGDAFGSSASEPQPAPQAASTSSASADLLAGADESMGHITTEKLPCMSEVSHLKFRASASHPEGVCHLLPGTIAHSCTTTARLGTWTGPAKEVDKKMVEYLKIGGSSLIVWDRFGGSFMAPSPSPVTPAQNNLLQPNFEAAFGTTPSTSSSSSFDPSGDLLMPTMAPAGQPAPVSMVPPSPAMAASKALGSDLDSSLASLVGNLGISGTTSKKGDLQWNAGEKKLTGGANWQPKVAPATWSAGVPQSAPLLLTDDKAAN